MMHKKNNMLQRSPLSIAIISLLAADGVYANANFNITPAFPLPTANFSTSSQAALFTVTNMTSSSLNGYVVSGVPTNVTQYTNTANSALCTNPINLGPNDTCLLQLNIQGPVHSPFAIAKGSSVTWSDEPLNVDLATRSLPLVAAGLNGDNSQPLIAQSPDGGTTWSYPPLPALGEAAFGDFKNASCAGLICVAVGEELSVVPNLAFNPLIARSQDGGLTWEYKTPANQSVSGWLHSVSCTGLTCVAVGEDFLLYIPTPLIAESQDGGLTWAYQPIPILSYTQNSLKSVSCSGRYCAAVGGSNNDPAVIATSTDWGITWAQQTITDGPSDSYFNSVSCNGPSCVAVGNYTSSSITYPYVVANTNILSSTWNSISILSTPQGDLKSVSCVNSSCVAVGTSTSPGNNPLSVYGTANAPTWEISSNDPSDTTGSFNGVSCAQLPADTTMSCVAVGQTDTSALIAASVDGGSTFVTQTISAIPESGVFNSVSCALTNTPPQSIHCLAAGQLTDNTPLVASSQGGVLNWVYASSLSGVSQGGFSGTSASTASLLPNSLRALIDEKRRQ
jgi:hypothetical protein